MDNFDGINEFVAVADAKGFSAAAKHLGFSTSHVSRQVNRLETRLGTALLARTTRQVSLTHAGAQYYQHCKELLSLLQQANEELGTQQYQLNGTLRVSAAGTFAELYVVPALIEFAKAHPGLALEIDFNSRMVDFVADSFDFAIRYGQLKDSGLIARKLVDRSMTAVASQHYLDQRGVPTSIKQLKDHDCLISNNDHWVFKQGGKLVTTKVRGRFTCNNAHGILRACEDSMGIAYLPRSNFLTLLEQEKVVPILEPFWNTDISSWIVYLNRRFLPMRARLAIDFLVNHFNEWEE